MGLIWDPHSLCPGCRDWFFPDNPCRVCEALTPEQRARSIQARALRLCRQVRRAGSAGSVSRSSQCGPVKGKETPYVHPGTFCQGTGGMCLTSPRSVVSRDGGRGSPSAASLSYVAADDGDTERNTSLGPRSQGGGSGVRSSLPPLRGAAEALSARHFGGAPTLRRHSSESSLDAYYDLPPDRSCPDRTSTGPDRTRQEPDQTTSRS